MNIHVCISQDCIVISDYILKKQYHMSYVITRDRLMKVPSNRKALIKLVFILNIIK